MPHPSGVRFFFEWRDDSTISYYIILCIYIYIYHISYSIILYIYIYIYIHIYKIYSIILYITIYLYHILLYCIYVINIKVVKVYRDRHPTKMGEPRGGAGWMTGFPRKHGRPSRHVQLV